MRYEWKCCECGESIEVDRKLADYKQPPEGEEALHGCESREFRCVLTRPNRIFVPEI